MALESEVESESEIGKENIRSVLIELASEVDGLLGLMVVDMDGVPIATHVSPGSMLNIELTAAQLAMVIRLSRLTADKLRLGELDEYLLTTPSRYILTRPIGTDCYLAMVLSRDAVLGMVRLLARSYATRLYQTLPLAM